MAIYHFSAQVISRGKGQSAVASASYRSGEKMKDERTGEVKFYQRDIQPESLILSPSHSPKWVMDREQLWNGVEASEKRKDAQLAREVNIALPVELNADQQKELICDYAQKEFVDRGMIADICIHRDDPKNPHAHIMLTTRSISEDGFGPKNRDWNKRELLEQWRESWTTFANRGLERAGVEDRISHLSHSARGIEKLPTIHLGHVASEMEKRGVSSDRGEINREIKEYNRNLVDLDKYREEKKAIENRIKQGKTIEIFTPQERIDLSNAAKVLGEEKNHKAIVNRLSELDRWEKKLNKGAENLATKDKFFKEAKTRFSILADLENQVDDQKYRLENTKFGLFKGKEKREFKEKTEQHIAELKSTIQKHQSILNKAGFESKADFDQKFKKHTQERPIFIANEAKQRAKLQEERSVLEKGKSAFEKGIIREVASKYPNNPEMAYLKFETANKLRSLNKDYSIQELKQFKQQTDQKIDRIQDRLDDRSLTGEEKDHHQEQGLKLNQSSSLLDGILRGIETAANEMARDFKKQQQKSKGMER